MYFVCLSVAFNTGTLSFLLPSFFLFLLVFFLFVCVCVCVCVFCVAVCGVWYLNL